MLKFAMMIQILQTGQKLVTHLPVAMEIDSPVSVETVTANKDSKKFTCEIDPLDGDEKKSREDSKQCTTDSIDYVDGNCAATKRPLPDEIQGYNKCFGRMCFIHALAPFLSRYYNCQAKRIT
ncbi:uncharacterized protein LOC144350480 [Saccoglossus kowalevskii]